MCIVGTAELLLEDWLLLRAHLSYFFPKKVPAILAMLEFLSMAKGFVIFFYNHPMCKVAQGVYVVLYSGEHVAVAVGVSGM